MQRIIKFGKTVRNNWKKSTVGVIAVYYGASYVKEKYEINILMQAACKEAVKHGNSMIPMDRNPTLITVILNPVANKRKAKAEFEKYCEPLLHLAGIQVEVIQTTSEGNAKEIMENLKGTEAIIVAGGDGTLSETVTGLLRRNDGANQFPLGVLPLGRTNTVGNTLFPGGKGVEKVKQLIHASMAIIKGKTEWKEVMKIEPISIEEQEPVKPIYAMGSLEWGAFRDTLAKRDKYWMYGRFREFAAFIFNGYKESLTWDCIGTIKYTQPCPGCKNCMSEPVQVIRKWSFLIPQTKAATADPLTSNPQCAVSHELCFKTCDFRIDISNVDLAPKLPALNIKLGQPSYSYKNFVKEGWSRLKGGKEDSKVIAVRTVEILPQNKAEKEEFIEIDKEEFDVKPMRVTLIPKAVKLFCDPEPDYTVS